VCSHFDTGHAKWSLNGGLRGNKILVGIDDHEYSERLLELLKADKRAFFTACSQASKAADYLRGFALRLGRRLRRDNVWRSSTSKV
jgi:antirestriction protein ArdC